MTTLVTPGQLILFEGPDGVGKSTISTEIARDLNTQGQRCEVLTFPGNEPGTLGKLVYDIHHQSALVGLRSLTPTSMQALHIAAHLDTIERKIIPALESGVNVILDRFWWSTMVYGIVGGIDLRILESLVAAERAQWGQIVPTLAVLLRRQNPIDRHDALPYWRQLQKEYDRLAEQERRTHPVVIVDNNCSLNETLDTIKRQLLLTRPSAPTLKVASHNSQSRQLQIGFSAPTVNLLARKSFPAHIDPIKPTAVYDTYWYFAAERQNIFFKRFEGAPPPWTDDPILAAYKFTNSYRASDRVSQYLIRHVIYREDLPKSIPDVFFRIMLFKIFNKIETWQLLEKHIGDITLENYSFGQFDRILSRAMADGQAIYSAAYIMPSGGRTLGHDKKHRNHLELIERMIAEELPQRLADARSMQQGFELLLSYPTIGDFLAYQYITDINYSEITNFKENEFVMPGPGALDGIRKCFADRGGLNEPEIIRFMADRQEREFERLGLEFKSLWGRPLQLIDCQNLFCEVDKYARVHHPEIVGISGRTRIKQRFMSRRPRLALWYPPKWNINSLIPKAGPSTNTTNDWHPGNDI